MADIPLEAQVRAVFSPTSDEVETLIIAARRAPGLFDPVALTASAANALQRSLRELNSEQTNYALLVRHLAAATEAVRSLAIVEAYSIH